MQSEKIGKSDLTSPNENEYNTEITGDRNKAGFYSDTIHSSDDKFLPKSTYLSTITE